MTMPKPKLVLVTIVGTLAYLGLAVLGWGGITAFFAHPARTALAVATVALAVAAVFTEGNLSPGEREDRGNRWVIAAIGVIGRWRLISLPTPTERISGPSTAIPFAGSVSFSLSPAARCGSGPFLCWGIGSVAWSRSSRGTRW